MTFNSIEKKEVAITELELEPEYFWKSAFFVFGFFIFQKTVSKKKVFFNYAEWMKVDWALWIIFKKWLKFELTNQFNF